ncbi:MAG TPA: sensor histidine kinase [Nocardioides sp.]|nr:sensor histidine kinase [Nocardioides sp.]
MSVPLTRTFDVGLAAAIVAAGVAEAWVPFSSRQGDGSLTATTLGVVAGGLALTQRRARPLAAGLAVFGAWWAVLAVAPVYVLFFGQFVAMAVATFSMARHGRGRVPFYGAGATAAMLLYLDLFVPELQSPGEIVFHWGVFALVWSAGFGLQTMERRARESHQRAVAAEVAAAEQALAAVVEERTRIARELHDIVAHSVSMMVVQAGAAEQVVDDDPAFVRRALQTIRSTGTDALSEMRRVVAMLREVDEPGALEPQPGLDSVQALMADARSAGLSAQLEVIGNPRPLPAGVDLAAYRIIQEALTNVRRHGEASTVRVELAYGDANVRIEVSDDGVGAADPVGGHGLIGMRERAALYGGSVEAGTMNGRGFVVRAVIPVGSVS